MAELNLLPAWAYIALVASVVMVMRAGGFVLVVIADWLWLRRRRRAQAGR